MHSKTQAKTTYSDVLRMLALRDANHPQKLVDVVARVTDHAAENNENVVDVERTHNLVRCSLV